MQHKRDDDINRQQHFNTSGNGAQSPSVAERLHNLFRGNEAGHCTFTGLKRDARNLLKCDGCGFKDSPLTVEEWEAHTHGTSGIGVTAVLKDGQVWFASIDLDAHGDHAIEFTPADVVVKIKNQKLPLVPVYSKNYGLHLFVFFKEPVPASMARRVLASWANALGFPDDVEIFPKQDTANQAGHGSNLWMPFFGYYSGNEDLPSQVMISELGNYLLVEEFIREATNKRITHQKLAELELGAPRKSEKKKDDKGPTHATMEQAQAWLKEACQAIREAVPGNLNNAVTHKCFLPGRLVAGGFFTKEEAWGDDTITERGLNKLYNAIKENPHNDEAMFKRGLASFEAGLKDPVTKIVEYDPLSDILDAGDDLDKPPPREWLLGNIFARKFLSTVFGDGGVGKTSLRYAQYMSIALGRSLTGDHVFQRCRVLIVSLEDDMDELRRRIWALRIHYGVSREALKGWLHLWAPGIKGGKLVVLDKKGNPILGSLSGHLKKLIAEKKVDFVGLDPFIKTHGVGENNNTAIDIVVQVLVDLTHELNIGADVPHHVSKAPKNGGGVEPGDADRGRGASALKDAARLVYTLNVMTKDEAEKFHIGEHDRWSYIRMDKGKVNIVPPAREARWFKLVNVPLGNANEIYKHGDDVQAVEQWFPPDVMSGLDNAQMDEILAKIDAGRPDGSRYTHTPTARTRAAWKVVVEVCPKIKEAQAKDIIKEWVKNKVLVSRSYHNEKERKDEDGLWRGRGE
jgi:hypothetical protein